MAAPDDGSPTASRPPHNRNHDARTAWRAEHEHAVLDAEVRRLVRALRPYRVLRRDALSRVARAQSWHEGTFEHALQAAIAEGKIEALPFGFYRIRDAAITQPDD